MSPASIRPQPIPAVVAYPQQRARQLRRAAIVGLVGAILLHLLGWVALPGGLFEVESGEIVNPYREYTVELLPEEEETLDPTYTQTNPDAPLNEPDETDRFGARDQQAANLEAPELIDPDNRPATESEDSIETEQFITGSLAEPALPPPPSQQATEKQEAAEATQEPTEPQPLLHAVEPKSEAQRLDIPIAGEIEELDPESEGIAENDFEKRAAESTNLDELVEGESEEGDESQLASPESAPLPRRPSSVVTASDGIPSPRPRLQLPRVPSGPVRNSDLGVTQTGTLAVDAKGTKFGEYMERLIETVSLNWDYNVQNTSTGETQGKVVVSFVLDRFGRIQSMDNLENTSGLLGLRMCRAAIEQGVPYGPWPPEVVELFGSEEQITFTFYYH